MEKAIQEYFPAKASHCFGCGTLNDHGLHIKSYWNGKECVCKFMPQDYHTAFEGFVYGGLIASIIDCHSMATAIAVSYEEEDRSWDSEPTYGFVTSSLKVDYLKPTPKGKMLEFRSVKKETVENKIRISTTLYVDGAVCAKGDATAAKMPLGLWG